MEDYNIIKEELSCFVGKFINDEVLHDIKVMLLNRLRSDVAKFSIDMPEFSIPKSAKELVGNKISIIPKDLFSAIYCFGEELPPSRAFLMNDKEWISPDTGYKYYYDHSLQQYVLDKGIKITI